MADLSTMYMGLKLRNPIVASSSRLTSSLEKVMECEQAGAGAVVLKSLFEEQIESDTQGMIGNMDVNGHADAFDFFSGMGQNYYINEYLKLVEDVKSRVSIPVIASLNCVHPGKWLEYAKRFENVGADALELNVFILPASVSLDGRIVEQQYLDILSQVKRVVSIPVAMKIGFHFSSVAQMLKNLCDGGADALVLFNRFYRPDIDIENMRIIPAGILSSPEEISLSLQWIALLSGELSCDLSAATGVHDGKGLIKQLLVGAKTVQLCSTLYKNGFKQIGVMLSELKEWMERHSFASIKDFNGKICQEASDKPEIYERSQYVKALVGIS